MIFVVCLTGCEDVIDVDLPTSEPRLVIDAAFRLFLTEDPIDAEGGVRLTLSTSFLNEEIPVVNNATVFITKINDGTVFPFEEVENSGFYIPSDSSIVPELNAEYELTVIYGEETYMATTRLIPTVAIDKIVQGDATLFGGDETEVIIQYTDNGDREDFYLLDLDFNLFLTTDDRFYQGEKFVLSYFYDNVVEGQDITVKINGVDEQLFNYWSILIDQSGQDGGGPFMTPPSTARGNIVNTTNPDNYPLGYFSVSESNRVTITIE